jgi:predicted MPP superfamily phosphohydrolase
MNGYSRPFDPVMKKSTPRPSTTSGKINWLSDLHLEKADNRQINHLLQCIAESTADCVAITGDISSARSLTNHLRAIAMASMPKPVFFVTGNHDYYGSSMTEVDASINALCAEIENLHYLNGRQIIPLHRHTCIIGHHGWPDARAGYGDRCYLRSPDHRAIRDFHGLTRQQSMSRMQQLGRESAKSIRQILPLALTLYPHVVVLTHTPPFAEAVRYNDTACGPLHLPHYTNVSAGLAIRGIARAFPKRRITILAGHSHSSSITHIDPNICVRVAHARTGEIGPQEILQLS